MPDRTRTPDDQVYHARPLPVVGPRQGPGLASLLPRPDPARPARSLYVHVPFCYHKCHYCDFYSIVDTRDRQAPFVDRLVSELEALAPWSLGAPLQTVFVGGGTPSLLTPPLWRRVLNALTRHFDLSQIRAGEFTVECNPETVTPELMATLAEGGVNRVSFGAQSFNRAHLKTLERWHDPENVPRAWALAEAVGIRRRSLDLIFAIPGQTLGDWDADLRTALDLRPEHVSCYALTFEPNTAMTARWARGEFARAPEDLEAAMFEHTLATLRGAGLDRYEVSNFARPGQESRHNLAYWRQEDWLAAGPAAAGHVRGLRWKNAPRLDDYLRTGERGFAPVVDVEAPEPRRNLVERLLTGLRLREGVDSAAVLCDAAALADGAEDRLARAAAGQSGLGLLDPSRGRWRLTDSGFLLADSVILALAEALDAARRGPVGSRQPEVPQHAAEFPGERA
ncbi:MAG: radical SAM family heme chaperone HemW [Phycisphaerae bacterium]|nr:radical SAM family heme chaperone HemW [Phycisphaerae bacterium]